MRYLIYFKIIFKWCVLFLTSDELYNNETKFDVSGFLFQNLRLGDASRLPRPPWARGRWTRACPWGLRRAAPPPWWANCAWVTGVWWRCFPTTRENWCARTAQTSFAPFCPHTGAVTRPYPSPSRYRTTVWCFLTTLSVLHTQFNSEVLLYLWDELQVDLSHWILFAIKCGDTDQTYQTKVKGLDFNAKRHTIT